MLGRSGGRGEPSRSYASRLGYRNETIQGETLGVDYSGNGDQSWQLACEYYLLAQDGEPCLSVEHPERPLPHEFRPDWWQVFRPALAYFCRLSLQGL